MIVLDTHVLLWWIAGDPALSIVAKNFIEKKQATDSIIVSSISAWEIAMLVANNRLKLSIDVGNWLSTVAQVDAVRFLPLDVETLTKSVSLPGEFHRDPADRIIVATARTLTAPLVTKDEKIRAYPHVKTIWD